MYALIFFNETLPSTEVVGVAQQRALTQDGVRVSNAHSSEASVGATVCDSDGIFRLSIGGSQVLWMPKHVKELEFWLMICAHMRQAGDGALTATLIRLHAHCWWRCVVADVKMFVQPCLHCVELRVGGLVPRIYGDTVHGPDPNDAVHWR